MQKNYSNWIEKDIKNIDGILLYGEDLFIEPPSKEVLESIYKKYLVDVLMSIRHYISAAEPNEKMTYSRIKKYILKPLMFPLRVERYCNIGRYPTSNEELLNAYEGIEKEIVAYFLSQDTFNRDMESGQNTVMKKLHDSVQALIGIEEHF